MLTEIQLLGLALVIATVTFFSLGWLVGAQSGKSGISKDYFAPAQVRKFLEPEELRQENLYKTYWLYGRIPVTYQGMIPGVPKQRFFFVSHLGVNQMDLQAVGVAYVIEISEVQARYYLSKEKEA